MKKIFVGIIVFFCILVNVSFGYTLTVNNFSMDVAPGRQVTTTASTGKTFINWTYSGITLTSTEQTSKTLSFTMPNQAVTLVANYEEVLPTTYTVTFNANGGSGSMSPQTFTDGVAQNLTTNAFSKSGYNFLGWSLDSSATGATYGNSASYIATGNITLYAVWSTDSYSITYELNGGTVSGNPVTYNINTPTITLNNPTKTGYTFLGWTGSNGNTNSTTVTIPKGSTGNKTYIANWELSSYIVTFNKNDGSGTTTTQTFRHGVAQNLTTNTFTRSGYTFLGWSADSGATSATYTNNQSYMPAGNVTLYAIWKVWAGWNEPTLVTGLTPVNWDGSKWVTTTVDKWDYNYKAATSGHNTVAGNGTAKWANAQTADGSLYVWIPRYTYKITSGYHSTGNSWNSVDSPGTNKIEVKFSQGTEDEVTEGAANASKGYISHPAFTFGEDELEGIWVAKYEASRNNATASSVGTGTTPTSKPGVKSWRGLTVSQIFDYSYNLNRDLDTHMMKNSEWGAVAYLTNAIGIIPYVNNNNFITGSSGGIQNAGYNDASYLWNTAQGVKASTTHNVYGIYDMSAGSYEYVAAYVDNKNAALTTYSNSLVSAAAKYKDVYMIATEEQQSTNYELSKNKNGDAVYETGTRMENWDVDTTMMPVEEYPIFLRGGVTGYESSGIFSYSGQSGDALCYTDTGEAYSGFRVALAIPKGGVDKVTYKVTVTQGANGSVSPSTITIPKGSSQTFTLKPNSGYAVDKVILNGVEQRVGPTYTLSEINQDCTLQVTFTNNIIPNANTSGANAPVTKSGLTPVNWDGTKWVTTTTANWKYNYNSVAEETHNLVHGTNNGAWANAQTSDGSLYVWIPRYTYKITSGEHAKGYSWNNLDNEGTNKIEIKFSNGTTDNTSDGYIVHPAFNFGSTKLKGIWVAKYEASKNDATATATGSGTVATSKPGVQAWSYVNLSTAYTNAYNVNRSFESHLMKNSEWGAVAYLTNAIGRIPYRNNSSNGITGNAGNSYNDDEAWQTTNDWNTSYGVKASTTHNVYGIYDMSGGLSEFVAAYVNNSSVSQYSSNIVSAADKYKDVYPVASTDTSSNNYSGWSGIKGDAIYETSAGLGSQAWDNVYITAPTSTNYAFQRGGNAASSLNVGIFSAFTGGHGTSSAYGFRVVFAIP